MAVTWDYNGSNQLQVTLSASTVGHTYEAFTGDFNGDSNTAAGTGSAITITLTGIGGNATGEEFYATVRDNTGKTYLGVNVFKYGTASTTGVGFPATWTYDGSTGVSVAFTTSAADNYQLQVSWFDTSSNSGFGFATGPGAPLTLTATISAPATGSTLVAWIKDSTVPNGTTVAARVFVEGVADGGSAGDPGTGGTQTGTAAAADDTGVFTGPVRVGIAFDSAALDTNPTWVYITDGSSRVGGYTVDRGRQFEFDKTDAGTAVVSVNDRDGTLDPTNTAGPYFGLLEPLLQIRIELWNPVDLIYQTRFRGWIEDYDYSVDFAYQDAGGTTHGVTRLQINCVDIFEILTAIEMQPDGSFGDDSSTAAYADATGNIYFAITDGQGRIDQVTGNAGIPTAFYVCFTLNINVQETVYSPSENVLQVIQDVADAEFPTVANVYTDRLGRLAIHGRLAKFDPAGTASDAGADAWDFTHWKAGDGKAVHASPTDTAHIRGFAYNRGLSMIRNAALCTPNHIDDPETTPGTSDIPGQYVTDTPSIGLYGIRSWSAENLLVEDGILTGNDKLDECLAFANFIKANYAEPRNRITEITFKAIHPDEEGAAANWDLLGRADISDLMDVTVRGPGDSDTAYIFNAEPFFIEGVHEECTPATGEYAMVTMSLDLSPQAYFAIGAGVDGGT